jgi:hypothetical protein
MTRARGCAGDLRRIVHINEEIKRVVATAFKINLMAMNAIFLAKRAGQAALGFSVLSNELRRFAADLQQQMEMLRQITYGSVGSVTAMVKSERLDKVLARLGREATGLAWTILDDYARKRSRLSLSPREEAIVVQQRRLSQAIADTAQLVELGGVMARSAKIEAAYGGTFSAALMQVSSDFERIISEIRRSLELLSRDQA